MNRPLFVEGREYDRQSEIHDIYGGNRQSGIAACAQHPFVFLFSSARGDEYGYVDGWDDDGFFLYSGEGQVGEMTMSRGNAAIRDHVQDGRELHLFSRTGARGKYEYVGRFVYVSHREMLGKDADGGRRSAIQFRLKQV
jgi:5-methylcytosine-specific restriction enzyme A